MKDDESVKSLEFRLRYFMIHLACSFSIALLIWIVIFYFWYPNPLDVAIGVTKIVMLMLVVDCVLGPALTFLVAKQGKRSLKFDLMFISVIQLSAMLYGLYHVYIGRPVWLVYEVDRFVIVRANDLDQKHSLPKKIKENFLSPQWIGVKLPEDQQSKQNLMIDEIFTMQGPAYYPEFYVPLSDVADQIAKHKQPISNLVSFNSKQNVFDIQKNCPQAKAYIPLKGVTKDMTILLDSTNKPIKIVNIQPW